MSSERLPAGKGRNGSVFAHVEQAAPDAVFNVAALFRQDKHPKKVNLSIGAYRNEEGLPWVLPVVRTVEAQMSTDPMLNHEYLPLDGMTAFTEGAAHFLLGKDSPAVTQNRYCAVQAISGTGSLRLAMEFLHRYLGCNTVYLSKPTWANHRGICEDAGLQDIREYRYYKQETRGLDIAGMIADLRAAPSGSVVILHACAHNPTGLDPSKDQWKEIFAVLREGKIFPLMDTAYQGFATGNVEDDAWAVREMVREGFELFAAQSFSKNFGLYNERVGQLCCVLADPESATAVKTRLVRLTRRMWSNAPNHGARIVATTLNNPTLYQEWLDNLTTMTDRIKAMREALYQLLKTQGTPGDWAHVLKQTGMFSFTGLTPTQVEYLTREYHIYLLSTGRINVCGLNPSNVEYVAKAIHDAVTTHPEQRDSLL